MKPNLLVLLSALSFFVPAAQVLALDSYSATTWRPVNWVETEDHLGEPAYQDTIGGNWVETIQERVQTPSGSYLQPKTRVHRPRSKIEYSTCYASADEKTRHGITIQINGTPECHLILDSVLAGKALRLAKDERSSSRGLEAFTLILHQGEVDSLLRLEEIKVRAVFARAQDSLSFSYETCIGNGCTEIEDERRVKRFQLFGKVEASRGRSTSSSGGGCYTVSTDAGRPLNEYRGVTKCAK